MDPGTVIAVAVLASVGGVLFLCCCCCSMFAQYRGDDWCDRCDTCYDNACEDMCNCCCTQYMGCPDDNDPATECCDRCLDDCIADDEEYCCENCDVCIDNACDRGFPAYCCCDCEDINYNPRRHVHYVRLERARNNNNNNNAARAPDAVGEAEAAIFNDAFAVPVPEQMGDAAGAGGEQEMQEVLTLAPVKVSDNFAMEQEAREAVIALLENRDAVSSVSPLSPPDAESVDVPWSLARWWCRDFVARVPDDACGRAWTVFGRTSTFYLGYESCGGRLLLLVGVRGMEPHFLSAEFAGRLTQLASAAAPPAAQHASAGGDKNGDDDDDTPQQQQPAGLTPPPPRPGQEAGANSTADDDQQHKIHFFRLSEFCRVAHVAPAALTDTLKRLDPRILFDDAEDDVGGDMGARADSFDPTGGADSDIPCWGFRCSICFAMFFADLPLRTRSHESVFPGAECSAPGRHFTCSQCASGCVARFVERGEVVLPAIPCFHGDCMQAGGALVLNDFSSVLELRVWRSLQDAAIDKARRIGQREVMTHGVGGGGGGGEATSEELKKHCQAIRDLLVPGCPSCGMKFHSFSGCTQVTCKVNKKHGESCGEVFCGACLVKQPCGKHSDHAFLSPAELHRCWAEWRLSKTLAYLSAHFPPGSPAARNVLLGVQQHLVSASVWPLPVPWTL